ncbi:MAG: alpha/beta hydrolase fold protein [Amycolatopsis sp.]|uniref:alpha/beta fold hydrolase n=1 Tax=Amycolatopsis sp. TaxID=37632 RepID=UPI0026389972|nr:alpha/beta hydrolase [Amycolatopsis sp.]MCU1686637.1 alpha/beta hydrolase fold protein [Amycolatopsis sp.]
MDSDIMDRVTSADGTTIAFDRLGDGPPVIVVSGALCNRAVTRPLADNLAQHYTVYNYDRRGRGDSGDIAPYAVEREIEDLAAILAAAGGSAAVYGHSSGAALTLYAAARGLDFTKIVLHEPPFVTVDDAAQEGLTKQTDEILDLLTQDRRREAVERFLVMTDTPAEYAVPMSQDPGIQSSALTIRYDLELVGEAARGGATPTEQASKVTVPALVLAGGASDEWMIDAGRRLAEAIQGARFGMVDGFAHVVPPAVLVPILAGFLNG